MCKAHLLAVLPLMEESLFESFMLETNGVLFGADADFARQMARFEKVHVRLSLKAATPEGFQERTGACGETVELPFQGIRHLLQAKVSFHVAAMTDPRLMPADERELLISRLADLEMRLVENLELDFFCDNIGTR